MNPPGATGHRGERDDAEGEEDAGMGRPASAAFAPTEGDMEGSEDIVWLQYRYRSAKRRAGDMRLDQSRRREVRGRPDVGFYGRPGENAKVREVRR